MTSRRSKRRSTTNEKGEDKTQTGYYTSYCTKEWWRTVNKITDRKTNNDKAGSVINSGRINDFFQMINTDTQYTTPIPVIIPDGTRVPIVDENDVRNIMINLKQTGPGPDGLPYWLWKDFAPYLALTLRACSYEVSWPG